MSEQLKSAKIFFLGGGWGRGTSTMKKKHQTQQTEVISEETKLIKETEDKIKMNLNVIQQDLKGYSIYNK